MPLGGDTVTRETAQIVAENLVALYEHGAPGATIKLDTVCHVRREGMERSLEVESTVEVQIDFDNTPTTLADDTEVVHCLTRNGRRVSVILGHPEDREMRYATIIVERASPPTLRSRE